MARFQKNLMFISLLSLSGLPTGFAKGIAANEDAPTNGVRFTKDELKAAANPTFIRQSDFGTVLRDKIVLIATTLTARQGGSNKALYDVAAANTQISKDALLNKLAVIQYEATPFQSADSDKIRGILSGQTRKSGEVKFKETFPIIAQIQKGLSFKWSPGGGAAKTASTPTPEIKYGLIVEDIQPQSAPGIASVGSISDSYWQYSRPAKVVYTIDRLGQDNSSARVFTLSPTEPTPSSSPASVSDSQKTSSTSSVLASLFHKPSTDFDVKVEAANSEDTVSDKVGGGSVPGAKISVTQVEGLISTEVRTTSRLGKDSVFFESKLPIIGEACITRKWDEKFHPQQTSANNLLVTANAPKLNIHHYHTENKFKGELLLKRPTYEFTIALEPRAGWDTKARLGEVGDKISVTFQNSF